MVGYRRFGARLSDDAADGWENWAAQQGLTVSALLEAIGCELADDTGGWNLPFEELPEPMQKTIRSARQIQNERRRRR